jgi:exoribonuclease R
MWEIARKLKEKRKSKILFDFNESDRKMEDNYKNSVTNKHIASRLIEEFMVA